MLKKFNNYSIVQILSSFFSFKLRIFIISKSLILLLYLTNCIRSCEKWEFVSTNTCGVIIVNSPDHGPSKTTIIDVSNFFIYRSVHNN